MVLLAAVACGPIGYYTETAVLLTVNDVHLPYDVPSLMAVQ